MATRKSAKQKTARKRPSRKRAPMSATAQARVAKEIAAQGGTFGGSGVYRASRGNGIIERSR